MASLIALGSLALLSCVSASPTVEARGKTSINFDVASAASSASPLSKELSSLSIEFCYITDYLGDVNAPNELSLQLLQNIQDIVGVPPIIRVGGHTQDAAHYNASSPETLINLFSPGNTEATDVTYNTNLFTVLNQNVPSGQEFIFGLNFGANNVSIPLAEVAAAEKYMTPSRLYAYELGNEPDFYGTSQRPRPWNVQTYADQQVSWTEQLQKEIIYPSHGFQLGAFAQLPIYQGNFSLEELVKLGVPQTLKDVKSMSDHTYPFSICDPSRAALVSLPNLMNHTQTVNYFAQWEPAVSAVHSVGAKFVIGETGSVSCHGRQGVSNTLGAALWEVDYLLHGATLGFDGVYFHMGTPFFYSMWQPVAYNNTPATVWPTYYSMLLTANVLSGLVNPTVKELTQYESDYLAVYAIFDGPTLEKIVVLDLTFYTDDSQARPSQTIDVTKVLGRNVKWSRLTGPLSNSTDINQVTYAGQTYASGKAAGRVKVERNSNGLVKIKASEAVVISAR